MKRSCKNINITDWTVVYPWVLECVKHHKKRYDFRKMIVRIGGLTPEERDKAITINGDVNLLAKASANIAKEAVKRIAEHELKLSPCHIREKQDHSTLKWRMIGKECTMQQILDYIAVRSCGDIWRRRIVPQQSSSIKDRGQVYGTIMISEWLAADNRAARYTKRHKLRYTRKCKYYVKLDVTKCYQSMRVDRFMAKFKRDCGNKDILWLWETLLKSHRVPLPDGTMNEGFMIGALPSQMAAQYMLSFLYRHMMDMHYMRRNKQYKLITHMELFMDDILIIATSRKNLKRAASEAMRFANEELGLTIKPNWQICCIDDTPIDMMGFVDHSDGNITVRPRVFIKARRMMLRAERNGISYRQAKRLVSYKGYFQQKHKHLKRHLKWRKANKKYRILQHCNYAARIISKREEQINAGRIQLQAGWNDIHAASRWESGRLAKEKHRRG